MKIKLKFKVDKNIILFRSLINESWMLLNHEETQSQNIYEEYMLTQMKAILSNMNKKEKITFKEIRTELEKMQYIEEKYTRNELPNIYQNKIAGGEKTYKLLIKMRKNRIFKKEIKLTNKYKKQIKRNWKKYLRWTEDYLEEITGYTETIKGTVFIISPIYQCCEANIKSEEIKILYSTKENGKEPEKDIAYISHELLHNPILKYKNLTNEEENRKLHSIIQLATDKEIMYRLKNISYTENNQGHKELEEQTRKLYFLWIGYLYRNSQNIREKIEKALRRDGISSEYTEKIAEFFKVNKINSIYELIEYDKIF